MRGKFLFISLVISYSVIFDNNTTSGLCERVRSTQRGRDAGEE
jgi:hypothetical protein